MFLLSSGTEREHDTIRGQLEQEFLSEYTAEEAGSLSPQLGLRYKEVMKNSSASYHNLPFQKKNTVGNLTRPTKEL